MIIDSRFIKNGEFQSSFMRISGINFFEKLIKVFYKKSITDATYALRMVNKKIVKDFCNYYSKDYPEPEIIAMYLRKNYKIMEMSVTMKEQVENLL